MAIKNTVDNGVVISNLRADIMRKPMQPKGLLQHKEGNLVAYRTPSSTENSDYQVVSLPQD